MAPIRTAFVALVALLGVAVTASSMHLHDRHVAPGLGVRAGAPVAGANLELQASFFRKVIAPVLPLVNEELRKVHIPGGSLSGITFGPINFTDFSIGGVAVGFGAPNKVAIEVSNITLAVPKTDVTINKKISILDIHCPGWVSVGINDFSLSLTTALGLNATTRHLAVEDVTAKSSFGPIDLKLELLPVSASCKSDNGLIQLLLGTIEGLVKKEVAPLVAKAVEGALRNLTDTLPLEIVTAPVATATSIAMDFNLASLVGSVRAPAHPALPFQPWRVVKPAMVGAAPIATRDLMVWTTARALDVLLADIAAAGKLDIDLTLPASLLNTSAVKAYMPAAYNLCPSCPFNILTQVNARTAPTARFAGDSLSLSLNNQVIGLRAVDSRGTKIPLLSLRVNGTLGLTDFSTSIIDSVLKFKISLTGLSLTLDKSHVGPFNAPLLTQLLQQLLSEFLVPYINEHFKGIPLSLAGFGLTDVEVYLQNGVNAFGANIAL